MDNPYTKKLKMWPTLGPAHYSRPDVLLEAFTSGSAEVNVLRNYEDYPLIGLPCVKVGNSRVIMNCSSDTRMRKLTFSGKGGLERDRQVVKMLKDCGLSEVRFPVADEEVTDVGSRELALVGYALFHFPIIVHAEVARIVEELRPRAPSVVEAINGPQRPQPWRIVPVPETRVETIPTVLVAGVGTSSIDVFPGISITEITEDLIPIIGVKVHETGEAGSRASASAS